jgi:hypothetical protein
MSENEFEHEGKRYRAVDSDMRCDKCSLYDPYTPACKRKWLEPSCHAAARSDGKSKIFVEVKP